LDVKYVEGGKNSSGTPMGERRNVKKRGLWMAVTAMTLVALLLSACGATATAQPEGSLAVSELQGEIVIFHAGSLTVPMKALTDAFQALHPRVTFETEASGSNSAARKISELGREADVMVSSDYRVIDKLLIPDWADWNVQFVRNTMVIAYTDQSLYGDEVGSDNWYDVLTREGVVVGRGDPDVDPCGYRTLLVWQLAEKHYGVPGLYRSLDEGCPLANVRPKSEDLIALLQSGDMDYAWEYGSVAVQHGLNFVELPDEINLSQVEHADFYALASVEVAGKEPNTTMTIEGTPIVYGVTIPNAALSPDLALEFVKFLLGPEGQEIMEQHGQPPIVPPVADDRDALPPELQAVVQ